MSYYQDLEIWKKSLDLIQDIYEITKEFPKTEQYSLVDQMKRASVSVASNIAEGSGRGSAADNVRFLHIAKGSLVELEAQMYISSRLDFVKDEIFERTLEEIISLEKMISSFIAAKKRFSQPI